MIHCPVIAEAALEASIIHIDPTSAPVGRRFKAALSDAKFAIKELLPVLSTDATEQALEIILEDYKKFKEEETK